MWGDDMNQPPPFFVQGRQCGLWVLYLRYRICWAALRGLSFSISHLNDLWVLIVKNRTKIYSDFHFMISCSLDLVVVSTTMTVVSNHCNEIYKKISFKDHFRSVKEQAVSSMTTLLFDSFNGSATIRTSLFYIDSWRAIIRSRILSLPIKSDKTQTV